MLFLEYNKTYYVIFIYTYNIQISFIYFKINRKKQGIMYVSKVVLAIYYLGENYVHITDYTQ